MCDFKLRFCSVRMNHETEGALFIDGKLLLFSTLSKETGIKLPLRLIELITARDAQVNLGKANDEIIKRDKSAGHDLQRCKIVAPYYDPPKIWGIGLNYKEHASDLGADLPDEPASFMKPRTSIIGNGDPIELPSQSKRVTAEAELGIIIGKRCRNIHEDEAESVMFGYVPVLDMTAEDILQRNPRFLTRAKSFDTFFSFGPFVLTPDEVENVQNISVSTVLNGHVVKTNKVCNMLFSPYRLISFHSKVMTLEPGDIISTGTPGAVVIREGDVAECRLDGFPSLSNPVEGGA